MRVPGGNQLLFGGPRRCLHHFYPHLDFHRCRAPSQLGLQQDFDGPSLIHRRVGIGNLVEGHDQVEDQSGLDGSGQHVREQFVDDVRKALPGFITHPMPVSEAAAAVINGIEGRSPRVTAAGWVGPCSPSAESRPRSWTNAHCTIPE